MKKIITAAILATLTTTANAETPSGGWIAIVAMAHKIDQSVGVMAFPTGRRGENPLINVMTQDECLQEAKTISDSINADDNSEFLARPIACLSNMELARYPNVDAFLKVWGNN